MPQSQRISRAFRGRSGASRLVVSAVDQGRRASARHAVCLGCMRPSTLERKTGVWSASPVWVAGAARLPRGVRSGRRRPAGLAEFGERLLFDLAYAFGADSCSLADVGERLGGLAEAEACVDDVALACGQGSEQRA